MPIKLFNVTWSTDTAGVSPHNNMRTELFFKGCNKAISGNACRGCFNTKLWDNTAEYTYTPEEMANQIIKNAPNKYITIGGGEPTDQIDGLIELTKLLKKAGFHIMVYTWRSLEYTLSKCDSLLLGEKIKDANFMQKMKLLLDNIDMLVDGIYDEDKRLYDKDAGDGLLSSIGSGNQVVWDVRDYNKEKGLVAGYRMEDLGGLYIKSNNDLVYILKEDKNPILLLVNQEGVA